jgi:hypothetical protein
VADQTSALSIPPEWREGFLIKRIDEEDILITLEQRNAILKALNEGTRFIQVGKFTLMLNSIKSIDPVYPPDNIPPRPEPEEELVDIKDGTAVTRVINQEKIDLWDSLYGSEVKALPDGWLD